VTRPGGPGPGLPVVKLMRLSINLALRLDSPSPELSASLCHGELQPGRPGRARMPPGHAGGRALALRLAAGCTVNDARPPQPGRAAAAGDGRAARRWSEAESDGSAGRLPETIT
jgi:hypothetical protein